MQHDVYARRPAARRAKCDALRCWTLLMARVGIAEHPLRLRAQAQARPDAAPAPTMVAPPFRHAETDITDLQRQMRAGTLDSHALVQAYLDRIAAIDDAGPMLNAVIELNPVALAEADARDAERKAGTLRGPLHGIPEIGRANGRNPVTNAHLVCRLLLEKQNNIIYHKT